MLNQASILFSMPLFFAWNPSWKLNPDQNLLLFFCSEAERRCPRPPHLERPPRAERADPGLDGVEAGEGAEPDGERYGHLSQTVHGLSGRRSGRRRSPTSPFTILETQNPWIDEFYVVQEHRATNFKALKLRKGSSGRRYYDKERRMNRRNWDWNSEGRVIRSIRPHFLCGK